ncbi:nuclear pore complex protein Nup50-like [Lytechinus variegatus]|uniref:nuclear pore complex protein Nup50-like n=1 Tax=Lytechinus variegatus TaxID=7654 RepID=UPI001BB107BD|nr:nuclear pore complex protein Nup50-like [Lytechinus variegatus]XP_041471935.1 nuclear pore complex protein Nup50-like [Lytechinus variegatus]
MSKRRAGVELTHDNWDQDEEVVEEAGTFAVADNETLSRRPMIKAKRRVKGQQQEKETILPPAQTPFAAFKGFSGFGASTQSSSTPSASFGSKPASFSSKPDSSASFGSKPASFSSKPDSSASFGSKPASFSSKPDSSASFGSNSLSFGSKPVSSASFGSKPDSSASTGEPQTKKTVTFESAPSSASTFSFKASTDSQPSTNMFTLGKTDTDSKSSSNGSVFSAKSENGSKDVDAYADEITALNRSVSAWIQKHVEGNPVCDLTPIFEDYKKHLGEIEEKQAKRKESKGGEQKDTKVQFGMGAAEQEKSSSTTAAAFTGFKFGGKPAATESEKAPSAPKTGFSFGDKSSSETKGLSFGTSSSLSSSSSILGSTTPKFSFGTMPKPASSSQDEKEKEEEESDEPPKVEVKVIEEKDALYSTRCKVFYKKGSEFKERGVGMLHVKAAGGTAQLLIRADTTLGNIILNIGVVSSMLSQVTKQGKNKNSIMLLSPLNPPAEKKCPKCNKNYLNPQESTACEEGCAPTPTPLLLRVKTEADADKLIEQLKKICEDK